VDVVVSSQGKSRKLKALVDSGAQGPIYVDAVIVQSLCDEFGILPVGLVRPKFVNGYDGGGEQRITESIHPTLTIGEHVDANAPMHVANLCSHDLILGYTYLRNHGIVIDPGPRQGMVPLELVPTRRGTAGSEEHSYTEAL
jgi:hypothetical protein